MLPQEIGQQATAMIDVNDIPAAIAMINLPVLSVVQGANGYGGILLLSGIFLVLFALSEKKWYILYTMQTEKTVKPKPGSNKIPDKAKEILHINKPNNAKDPENKHDGSRRHG